MHVGYGVEWDLYLPQGIWEVMVHWICQKSGFQPVLTLN